MLKIFIKKNYEYNSFIIIEIMIKFYFDIVDERILIWFS